MVLVEACLGFCRWSKDVVERMEVEGRWWRHTHGSVLLRSGVVGVGGVRWRARTC